MESLPELGIECYFSRERFEATTRWVTLKRSSRKKKRNPLRAILSFDQNFDFDISGCTRTYELPVYLSSTLEGYSRLSDPPRLNRSTSNFALDL